MLTLLSSLVYTSTWGTQKKGCDNDTFRTVFPSIWLSWDLQTLQNKGKRRMTNRPCFYPPPPQGETLAEDAFVSLSPPS